MRFEISKSRFSISAWRFAGAYALIVAFMFPANSQAFGDAEEDDESNRPVKQLYRGEVLLVPDALKKLDIKAYKEELADQVALLTPDNELLPILPDWRGRAFFQDERLRNRKVELIGLRRPGLPYLQVISIYTFDEKGERQLTDYWCDICSIPMYEIKPCDCCQQPIRLRFRPRELPADLANEEK